METVRGLRSASQDIRRALFPTMYVNWMKLVSCAIATGVVAFDRSLYWMPIFVAWIMDLFFGFLMQGLLAGAIVERLHRPTKWYWLAAFGVMLTGTTVVMIAFAQLGALFYLLWTFTFACLVIELAELLYCQSAVSFATWSMWVALVTAVACLLVAVDQMEFRFPAAVALCVNIFLISMAMRDIGRSISIYPAEVAI
jgi:hypothetical protein